MKGAENMGKGGSPNSGKLKYQGQGSVGHRGSSNTPAMPRAQQTQSGKGTRPLKKYVPC